MPNFSFLIFLNQTKPFKCFSVLLRCFVSSGMPQPYCSSVIGRFSNYFSRHGTSCQEQCSPVSMCEVGACLRQAKPNFVIRQCIFIHYQSFFVCLSYGWNFLCLSSFTITIIRWHNLSNFLFAVMKNRWII